MNTLQTIYSRKSVRGFTGDITQEQLDTLLKVAYAAPIGRALYENVHITVITNEELLRKIDAAGRVHFNTPDVPTLYGAKTYFVLSAKLQPDYVNVGYSNCAIVVQNMALAAVELGLGACHIWGPTVALSKNEELVKELNLPEGFTPCCGLVVGQTDYVYVERDIPEGRIQTAYIK